MQELNYSYSSVSLLDANTPWSTAYMSEISVSYMRAQIYEVYSFIFIYILYIHILLIFA